MILGGRAPPDLKVVDFTTLAIILFDVAIIFALLKIRKRAAKEIAPPAPDVEAAGPARAALVEAGENLGLERRVSGPLFSLSGTIDTYAVTVEPMGGWLSGEVKKVQADTRITVEARNAVPWRLALYPRPSAETAADEEEGRRVEIGDPDFDQRYLVEGPEFEARALLGLDTRRAILAFEGKVTVRQSRICCIVEALSDGGERLERLIRQSVELTRHLSIEGKSLRGLLYDSATEDTVAEVRAASLTNLLAQFPDEKETLAACRLALEDADPTVRFLGAVRMGKDGFDVCEKIARSEATAPPLRTRALRHVAVVFRPEQSAPVFQLALRSRDWQVRQGAAQLLGRLKHRPAISWLLELLPRAGPATAATIAEALGEIGDSASELALTDLLDHESNEVRLAAIFALGSVGTAASVPHLRERADELPTTTTIRTAIKDAISDIQHRLAAEPGRLSLAQDSEVHGSLSVAADQRGAVSETPDDPSSSP